jgi:hypothetical protein
VEALIRRVRRLEPAAAAVFTFFHQSPPPTALALRMTGVPRIAAPYGVPAVILGRQNAPCAGSRARVCPVPGHPCLDLIDPGDVAAAVAGLSAWPAERPAPAEVSR